MLRLLLVVLLTASLSHRAHSQTSNTCLFTHGPRAGTTQAFPGYPAIALGSLCNDGVSSRGIATHDGGPSSGSFSFVGNTPSCTDALGTPVPYAPNQQIPKSGLATIMNGRPVILLKTSQIATFAPPVALFLYAHECGHHALGQVVAASGGLFIGPDQELAADCFALKTLSSVGLMGAAERNLLMQFLLQVPGDNTTYPGPIRVQKLSTC